MTVQAKEKLSPEIEAQLKRLRQEMIRALEHGKLFGLDLKVRQIQRNTALLTRV